MKIKVRKIMKVKTSSHCETVVTSSFRACSFAMDDGGRCLADVINDPLLLQSFLESGSDDNSKDPQDGTSSESAVESPQVSRTIHTSLSNHVSAEHIVESSEPMGYIYTVDNQGTFAVEPRVSSQSGVCSSSAGLGGVSLVVASSSVGPQTYQHASSSGATIHHLPSSATHAFNPHSPASARPATPLSTHNIKSPVQGPSSVHSMPPPSPLQQTRSPLPSHTPSPAPAWSPAPPVLSPATSRTQPSMPSIAFQQSHNQILQTTCNVTQFVTAIATPQAITQKLAVQQQQQLFLQQQLSPVSQQQPTSRLTAAANTVVTTAAVTMTPNVVQFIPAPQPNVCPPARTSHTVRPIQPKLPPQILPKPTTCSTSNQFVSPAPNKQTPPTPVTAGQRTMGVGIQPNATGQLVIGQSQSGVFSSPPGTILLNQIIPGGIGQSPILIQGNLGNLANVPGLQLTLRPPSSASPGQPLNSNSQNNATIIAALQNTSQHAHTLFAPAKSPIHGQQTIVIPNNLAHPGIPSQNINLTSAAIPNSSIMSSSSQGQGFLRSNIILPRVVGANQGQHILQHIQTPQGPILACIPSQAIAVPHLPVAPTLQNAAALGNAQLAPVTLPMHGVMTAGQGVLSGLSLQAHQPPSALQQQQSLFGAAVPFTSHVEQPSHQMIQVPQPLASPQVPTNINQVTTNQTQSLDHSSKPSSPSKTSKAALGISSILSDILKETGIVPENSPPPSPDSNSPVIEEQVPSNLQASNAAVPPQQLIATSIQPQVLLESVSQNLQGPGLSHMKLALAQDGSVILQPQNTFSGSQRVQSFVQSPQMQGRAISSVGSVILPTVSTCTVPVVSTESSIARSHANLIARLNSPPPVSVPDVSSLGVSSIGGCISTSITATIVTTTTNTMPITVQSLNVSSCLPIVSTGYVTSRNNVAITSDRVFYTEDAANIQNHVMNAAETSVTTSNVQRFNHINSGFQTLVVSSESLRNSMQNTKAVQSIAMGNGSTTNLIVQAETDKSGQTHEVAENSSPSVPSLINLPPYQNVPNNQIIQVQKLQKQINDLSTLKYHSQEQQKAIQHSHTLIQKLSKNKGCRNIQNQIQKHETEVKNIVQRSQTAAQIQPIPDQMQQHINVKPALSLQQPSENTKQQISANSSNQSLHLVNLLKQGPSHASPVKHSSPAVVTTCSVIISTAMSTATTNVTNTVNSNHQRIVNQVQAPAQQQRMQPVHQQKSQTENCQPPQPQVIVRMPKPQQQQQSQACQNVVHLKAAAPVKKVVVNTVPKTVLFNEQLNKDQNGAVCPDVNTPFKSKDDACSRLLKYHVYNTRIPSFKDMCSADETFEMVSVQLLEKKKALENKFRFLQLKDGMRPCPTPDRVLLERLFIEDEKESLKEDKTAVKEGKKLNLPPLPTSWIEEVKEETPCDMPPSLTSCQSEEITVKKEIEDNDCHSTEFSDSMREDSDPVYKDDDNLEAPVIDSCADIIVPQHDENCERSPPTLKRIVIKPEKRSESDTEEPVCNKRLKFNNYDRNETNSCERNSTTTFPPKSITHRESGKELEVKTNHKYPHVPLTRESFHSDNRIDDMVTKIRKELNMSPMEMDDDDLDTVSSHVVDFEPPSGTNDLADFEPPVARTEESCDSTLLYNNSVRTNCDVKYDYEMLGSVWDDNYVHPSNESGVAVGNVIEHGNPSDLDLSGLDGLDHIEESQPSIPNGIQDVGAETDISYMAYHFPKSQKRFHEVSSVQPTSNCSSNSSQIASAIKSIMGTTSENRSYYGAEDIQFLPGSKTGHNTHIADYGRSLDADMGVTTNNESDAVLDEAVRSILLR